MNNCIKCNKVRNSQQLVHRELCNSCYRKHRTAVLNSSGKYCERCNSTASLKWYGNICRNCWRKEHDRNDSLDKRLKNILRSRVSKIVSGAVKAGSATDNLGCSIEELKTYLESKFKPGMTWNNYGKYGWHIDHIRPLSSFNLKNLEDFNTACHYTNLQPLWCHENYKKGGRCEQ